MAAIPEELDRLYPLPANELHNQWVLTQNDDLIPPQWRRAAFGRWQLGWHPSTAVCDLLSQEGKQIGWVLSPLVYRGVDGTSCYPEEALALPVSSQASEWEIERALYGRNREGFCNGSGFDGYWIAVVRGGCDVDRFRRVYLSPSNSLVFSKREGVVAATPNLVPNLRRHAALSEAFNPLAKNLYYSFGLTAFEDVERLLPNHYLDLETLEPRRHWPRAELKPWSSGKEGAQRLVRDAQQVLQAVGARFASFDVYLSAGYDSRAVLACARALVADGKDVHLVTTYDKGLGARVDLQAAKKLAKIAGLPHFIKKRIPPDNSNRFASFARIGEARGGGILTWSSQSKDHERDAHYKLAGMGGETGRAFYWKRWGAPKGRLRPDVLAKRVNAPDLPVVLEACEAWLSGVPSAISDRSADLLDLAYVEQRLGCWAAPGRYMSDTPGGARSTSPMLSTFGIESMLRLPEDYRREGMLQRDMVEYAWPELLRIPFNQPQGLLKVHEIRLRASRKARRLLGHGRDQ